MTFNYREWLKKSAAKESELPEKALRGKKSPIASPKEISEVQLEDCRVDGKNLPTEKLLEKVRKEASSPSTVARGNIVQTAKKDGVAIPTEARLREKPSAKEPTSISETQLEKSRCNDGAIPTEKRLEKVRTGSSELLTEGLLDKSGSKLVKHRNPDTSKGDINKVEEQRIASKKTMEKEKYEVASKDDKKLTFPEVKGKDGLKTASTNSKVAAKGRNSWDDDDSLLDPSEVRDSLDMGYGRSSPRITDDEETDSSMFGMDYPIGVAGLEGGEGEGGEIDDELMRQIDDLTKDINLPSQDELAGVSSDIQEEDSQPNFYVEDISTSDVGGTDIQQFRVKFDPTAFANKEDAEEDAATWMVQNYPELDLNQVRESIVVDMDDGNIILSVPGKRE